MSDWKNRGEFTQWKTKYTIQQFEDICESIHYRLPKVKIADLVSLIPRPGQFDDVQELLAIAYLMGFSDACDVQASNEPQPSNESPIDLINRDGPTGGPFSFPSSAITPEQAKLEADEIADAAFVLED